MCIRDSRHRTAPRPPHGRRAAAPPPHGPTATPRPPGCRTATARPRCVAAADPELIRSRAAIAGGHIQGGI
eukprot:4713890-Prymnesium_polylepis.2